MRAELLSYLEGLSDPAYQRSCWVEGICPDGVKHDEFDYAIHFLFDDTELGSAPESCIGVFLVDQKEADCIRKVCNAINDLFKRNGTELNDADYITRPEWEQVISTARDALRVMKDTQGQAL